MDSIEINNLFFFFKKKDYCLFNYMITKIDDRKTKRQINTKTLKKNYDLIENKTKQIMKLNSQSV